MHKLKLSELKLSDAEVLTREELKKVLGGLASGGDPQGCCVLKVITFAKKDYGKTKQQFIRVFS